MQKIKSYFRSPQVLRLLHEHGPLSHRGLRAILEPPISLRSLQDVTKRLYQKGLLIKRFDYLPYRNLPGVYELPQSDLGRNKISKILKVSPDDLIQPYFKNQELHHSEQCAIWTEYLKKMFPDAEVIRDFKIHKHKLAKDILATDLQEILEIVPDILLIFKNTQHDLPVSVAIEVELSRKTDKRLIKKLRKYCMGCYLDGVVYVCSKNSLSTTLQSLYKNKLHAKNLRTGQYGNNFFLFCENKFDAKTCEPKLFNTLNEPVSLQSWVQYFKDKKPNFRRDSDISHSS